MTSWPTGSVALLLKRQSWGHPCSPAASAPFPEATGLLGLCPRARGEGYTGQSPGTPLGDAPGGMDPPVGDGLQSAAVAAGQPERAVGEDVGAVGDAQDQQVAARRLQQGLQPCFQTAPGDGQEVRERPVATSCSEKRLHVILGLRPRSTLPPTLPPPPDPGLTGCSGRTPPCSPSCPAAGASGSAGSASGPGCTTEPGSPRTAGREA